MSRGFRPEGTVFGLVLVAVGLVWTLGNLGHLDVLATLRRWWPLSLVVWGALELLAVAHRRSLGGPK